MTMDHIWLSGIFDLSGKTGADGVIFTIKDKDVRLAVNFYLNKIGIDTILTPRLIRVVKRVDVHFLSNTVFTHLKSNAKKEQMDKYIRKYRRKIYPEDWPDIVKLYEDGVAIASIAAEYDVTRQAIHYLLNEKDIIGIVRNVEQSE